MLQHVRERGMQELSSGLFTPFCCAPKTALKKSILTVVQEWRSYLCNYVSKPISKLKA
jgi:hypothetical protein